MSKKDVKTWPNSMKNRPWSSTKNHAWKHTPTNRKMFKKWLPNQSRKVTLFSGWRLVGHLWGPNPLFDIKSGPQRSQSASNDRKLTNEWYQRAPRLRKRAPKDKPFRALRKIMKRKSATTQHTNIFTMMKNPARRTARSAFNFLKFVARSSNSVALSFRCGFR